MELFSRAEQVLHTKFGFPCFRGVQEAAVRAALAGQDAFVLMPTGGGKSLCYALPSEVLPGVVLVVSPLIALMQDQVANFQSTGLAADFLSSTRTEAERRATLQRLAALAAPGAHNTPGAHSAPGAAGAGGSAAAAPPAGGRLQLLYVTPELISTQAFMATLMAVRAARRLSLIAVDEAHCISSWGHDFRPAYRQLAQLRRRLPGVPIMALTATAAKRVQEDIIASLALTSPHILVMSFNRPNIRYEVCYVDVLAMAAQELRLGLPSEAAGDNNDAGGGEDAAAFAQLRRLIAGASSDGDSAVGSSGSGGGVDCPCGIVYCLKRETAEQLARRLAAVGVPAASYHGKLRAAERSTVLADWSSGRVAVVVATVAFGMGVDKADVRLVVHWDLPKTLEGFYQESGRAGRDGRPSVSAVFYTRRDRRRMEFILTKEDGRRKSFKMRGSAPAAASAGDDDGTQAPAGSGGPDALTAFGLVVDMCCRAVCRRAVLLRHFGEVLAPGTQRRAPCCDTCSDPGGVASALARQRELEAAPRAVRARRGRPHGQRENAMPWELRGAVGSSSSGEGSSDAGVSGDSGSEGDGGVTPVRGGTASAARALRRAEAAERCSAEDAALEGDPTLRRMLAGAASKRQRTRVTGALPSAQAIGQAQRAKVTAALAAAIAANMHLPACGSTAASALAAPLEGCVFQQAPTPAAYRAAAGAALASVRAAGHWLELPHVSKLDEAGLIALIKLALRALLPPLPMHDGGGDNGGQSAAASPPSSVMQQGARPSSGPLCSGADAALQMEGMLRCLGGLSGITARVLGATGAGKAVNALRKHPHPRVASAAADVVAAWKAKVVQERGKAI